DNQVCSTPELEIASHEIAGAGCRATDRYESGVLDEDRIPCEKKNETGGVRVQVISLNACARPGAVKSNGAWTNDGISCVNDSIDASVRGIVPANNCAGRPAGVIGDQDSLFMIHKRGGSGRIRADEISLDSVIGAGTEDIDARIGIARDDIARASDHSSHEIVRRACRDHDA